MCLFHSELPWVLQEAMAAATREFSARLAADVRLRKFFGHLDSRRSADHLSKFMTMAFGGASSYDLSAAGIANLARAHESLGITEADFDLVAAHLLAALRVRRARSALACQIRRRALSPRSACDAPVATNRHRRKPDVRLPRRSARARSCSSARRAACRRPPGAGRVPSAAVHLWPWLACEQVSPSKRPPPLPCRPSICLRS